MSTLGILYDQHYKGVEFTHWVDELPVIKVFNSGSLPKDWYCAKKYFVELCEQNTVTPVLKHLSSVNRFMQDGGNTFIDYAWLDYDGLFLHYDQEQGGWPFFVDKNRRPDWNGLKQLAK